MFNALYILLPWQTCSIDWISSWLLWEASSHAAINAQRLCTEISTTVYSQVFIHLSEHKDECRTQTVLDIATPKVQYCLNVFNSEICIISICNTLRSKIIQMYCTIMTDLYFQVSNNMVLCLPLELTMKQSILLSQLTFVSWITKSVTHTISYSTEVLQSCSNKVTCKEVK